MAPSTTKRDLRPITLRSQTSGLSLRLTKGSDVLISGDGEKPRFQSTFGKYADFHNGQCILQAEKSTPGCPAYLKVWKSRDEAVAALRAKNGHGTSFVVVDLPPETAAANPGTPAS